MQMHKSINVGPSGQVNRINDQQKKAAEKNKNHKQDLIKAYLKRKHQHESPKA